MAGDYPVLAGIGIYNRSTKNMVDLLVCDNEKVDMLQVNAIITGLPEYQSFRVVSRVCKRRIDEVHSTVITTDTGYHTPSIRSYSGTAISEFSHYADIEVIEPETIYSIYDVTIYDVLGSPVMFKTRDSADVEWTITDRFIVNREAGYGCITSI